MIWFNNEHRKRATKSFATFIVECKSNIFHYRTGKYRCNHCDGSGTRIAPWAYSDPVEGYKMADRIGCPNCKGTGESDETAWRAIYKLEKDKYIADAAKEKETARLVKQALGKLSAEEIKALGISHLKPEKKTRKVT